MASIYREVALYFEGVMICFLPNAWSYARIHVLVMSLFGYDVNIPEALPLAKLSPLKFNFEPW